MTLSDQLQGFLAARDFLGLGNTIVEVLTRSPEQEHRPDQDAVLIAQRMRELIGVAFDIPPTLSYCEIYRDQHLSAPDRGRWDRDWFVTLLINAYVLGARRTNLPPPLDLLVPYFQRVAQQQITEIRRVADEYAKHQTALNAVREAEQVAAKNALQLVAQIQRILASKAPTEAKDEEVAALLHRMMNPGGATAQPRVVRPQDF